MHLYGLAPSEQGRTRDRPSPMLVLNLHHSTSSALHFRRLSNFPFLCYLNTQATYCHIFSSSQSNLSLPVAHLSVPWSRLHFPLLPCRTVSKAAAPSFGIRSFKGGVAQTFIPTLHLQRCLLWASSILSHVTDMIELIRHGCNLTIMAESIVAGVSTTCI